MGCESQTSSPETPDLAEHFSPQGPATSEAGCGNLVTGNVTLTANLNCTGDRLIVGDDGITINLNGFGIYGAGADTDGIGIGVSEDNVAINGPGIISGFQAGIQATEAGELTAVSLIMQDNVIGAFFTGADLASVEENIIKNNNIAVASHSASGINVESNLMDANSLAGVTFVNTDESAVSSNNIQGSQNAVFLDSQSTENTVQLNAAHDNVVDLNNANGASPTINQNTFADNDCMESNPPGLCFNATASQLPMGTVNETTTQEDIPQQTTTQNPDGARILINDAIRDLQNNDKNAALTHSKLAQQELTTSANSSVTDSARILVNDAIRDLQNEDVTAALTHLNLAIQQIER
jgi:hypothetical protein